MKLHLETKETMSDDQLESLVRLYQPCLSYPCVSMYLTLYQFGKDTHLVDIAELRRLLHIDLDTFKLWRQELEMMQLIETSIHESMMYIRVNLPLRPIEFLSHSIFGRYAAIVFGAGFEDVRMRYQPVTIPRGKDISKSFDINRLSTWDASYETTFHSQNTFESSHVFNVDALARSLTEASFPSRLLTPSLKQTIKELGETYRISYGDMRSLLSRAYFRKEDRFDLKRFAYLVDQQYGRMTPNQVNDVFDMDPVSYLRYRQNHDYVAEADRKLLESIKTNFDYTNDVVNVLVDHVYSQLNGNLNRNYIEKVAANWKRLKVSSKEEAIQQVEGMRRFTLEHESKRMQIQPEYETKESGTVSDDLLKQLDEFYLKGV